MVGNRRWSIEDVVMVARNERQIALSDDPRWRKQIVDGAQFLETSWKAGRRIYGVTTGYGDSCSRIIPVELADQLPRNLVRYLGCGLGKILNKEAATAVVVARLVSLAVGASGVRIDLLQVTSRSRSIYDRMFLQISMPLLLASPPRI